MFPMNVLNVNSSIDLKSGGGAAERTYQMSRAQALQGLRCTVLTLDVGLDAQRLDAVRPATVVALDYLWLRFHVPRAGWAKIRQLVNDADVIHLMGHWSVLNALVYIAARHAGKPYVVCPAGALPIFGRSAWLKSCYNFIVGRSIIRNASAHIAVTTAEFSQFASYGVPEDRVTVIPNGVRKKDFDDFDKTLLVARGLGDAPIILFMGRINPIKGPDLLLQAFLLVRDSLPGYQLIFAGPDGGLLAQLKADVEKNGLLGRVHFLGHIDGAEKTTFYKAAKLLVVPSRQEAMSIVALEAGICGTPVLLTDQCGFSEVREVDPGMEVPASVEAIAEGLVHLLSNPTLLAKIGSPWQHFVESRYAWEALVPVYTGLYEKILYRGCIE
jgi:glycosyltransferase involved in cell wall biosynthesis